MKMIKLLSAALGLACLLTAPSAYAEEIKLLQKNKKFYLKTSDGKIKKIKKLEINKGDKVTFINTDNISHNVYAKGKVADFEIAKQAPGASNSVVFDTAGKTRVRCAIHPRMKINIKVNE